MMEVNKKVNLRLVGLDGNAFNLIGAFQTQAKKEGWTKEEIKSVLDECMSGGYDHLLATLSKHCNDPSSSCDERDEEDDGEDYEIMLIAKNGGRVEVEESLTSVDDLEEAEELLSDIAGTVRAKYGY